MTAPPHLASPLRCIKCRQNRTASCSFSACPVATSIQLLGEREAARAAGRRCPYRLTRELAQLGVKRDMKRFEAAPTFPTTPAQET